MIWSLGLMLYNAPKRGLADCNMQLLIERRVGVLIVIAVCSLTMSLAIRFSVPSSSPSHTVSRRSVEPKRQHLEKDAIQWVVSDANFINMEPAVVETSPAPAGLLLTNQVFSNNLYNRPPPSSAFLL